MDVGAHDGVTINNTYAFENKVWRGVCVEPIEGQYTELIRNRPGKVCLYGCAYSQNCTLTFRQIAGYAEMLSWIESAYDPRHIDRIVRELNSQGGRYSLVSKPGIRLQNVFDSMKLTHIDYMTIDTEGSEMDVLNGIDFGRTTISVIDIENNYGDDRIKNHLAQFGYLYHSTIGGDDVYTRL